MRRLASRASIALTCNWFAIAWHCHRKGHDWETRRICWCRRQAHCRYCGKWRGDILGTFSAGWPICNFHSQWIPIDPAPVDFGHVDDSGDWQAGPKPSQEPA